MKKHITTLVLGTLSLLMISSTCGESPGGKYISCLYLKNNAAYSIGCYFANGGKYGSCYTNTNLPETDRYVISEIKPDKSYCEFDEWKKTYFPNHHKLLVFIFRTETLKKYDWSVIRDQYKILKRYELTLEDLKKSNWTITYTPGDEDQ